MANIRAHVYVDGRVQGVFFRAETLQQARMLQVTGWVKNLPDRRVELLVEGEQEKVEKLIAWCYDGPPYARVDSVEVYAGTYTGEFKSFAVTG